MTTQANTSAGVKEGDSAPEFTLPSFPAGEVKLSEFHGKKNVILAFYPKDDTPGCTKEMCAFSEDLTKFEDANTIVFGVSCDHVDSHQKFSGKYNLKQKLLADKDGSVGRKFGTMVDGKATSSRMLFVIDKNGKVRKVINGMPNNEELLTFVKTLG
ncbi:MAG TPA: peroxiredoxin [Oculatellaceae cyanobacterium]